jgi:acetyl esterase/lipase
VVLVGATERPLPLAQEIEWFWDADITNPDERAEITACPNQATVEQLKGLPPTLLHVDKADPLRDEGEAYAAKLRLPGVPVTTCATTERCTTLCCSTR